MDGFCGSKRSPRTCPKKDSRAGKGSGVQALRGVAECTGFVDDVQVVRKEKFLLKKSGDALEQADQGDGRVSSQETWRCGTEDTVSGHGGDELTAEAQHTARGQAQPRHHPAHAARARPARLRQCKRGAGRPARRTVRHGAAEETTARVPSTSLPPRKHRLPWTQ